MLPGKLKQLYRYSYQKSAYYLLTKTQNKANKKVPPYIDLFNIICLLELHYLATEKIPGLDRALSV